MSWILVPIDFSSCASMVVEEAIAFARAFDAGISLLHAAEAPAGLPLAARIHPPGTSGSVTVAEWLRLDATRHLAGFQALVERAGVPVRTAVQTGRARRPGHRRRDRAARRDRAGCDGAHPAPAELRRELLRGLRGGAQPG